MDEGAASSRFTFVNGGLQNEMTKGCFFLIFCMRATRGEPTHTGVVLQRGVDVVGVYQDHG